MDSIKPVPPGYQPPPVKREAVDPNALKRGPYTAAEDRDPDYRLLNEDLGRSITPDQARQLLDTELMKLGDKLPAKLAALKSGLEHIAGELPVAALKENDRNALLQANQLINDAMTHKPNAEGGLVLAYPEAAAAAPHFNNAASAIAKQQGLTVSNWVV